MSKPTVVALITPFSYQPFKSIRMLCEQISTVLTDKQTEVITITPPSFLGAISEGVPAAHRVLSAFERLTFSPMLLRLHLQRLERRAAYDKRDFLVLLSDQSLAIMGNALTGFKVVTFVSDLIAMRAALENLDGSGGKSSYGQRFAQRATLSGLHASSSYITPSVATAGDLANYLPASSARVAVAPLPLFNPVKPLDPAELSRRSNELWRAHGIIPPPYILCMGSSAWYKNRPGVIRIAAELKKLTPTAPALVFAGTAPTPEEETLIKDLGVHFYHFGDFSPDDLNTLYSGAECLLMPSFIEGFGCPAMEALASGTPLVITDTSSLMEYFAPAAAIVLPTPSTETLETWAAEGAKEIQGLLDLPAEEKQKIIVHGIAHASAFTPQRFREGILRALSLCV